MSDDELNSYIGNYVYLENCQKRIKKIDNEIIFNDKSQKAIRKLNELYNYAKNIANDFYNQELDTMNSSYERILINDIYNINNKISRSWYIVPMSFLYDYEINFNFKKYDNNSKKVAILDFIIHETYNIYQGMYLNLYIQNFKEFDLTNECKIISNIVNHVCKLYNVACQTIKIDAGFSNKNPLFDGNRFHYFNIIETNNQQYIVDCSYKQFFLANGNIINSLGIPNFATPFPGCYMIMNKERCKVAKEILKSGYILLTPENLKHYLDGFTLSFRNGLYYEQNPSASYTTPYTYNQYLEFLHTDVSLLDYEDKELLGYQKRPLKNSKFIFKTK